MKERHVIERNVLFVSMLVSILAVSRTGAGTEQVEWRVLSSMKGEIPKPDVGRQVATLIMDIDRDGVNDFVIASYEKIAWFRRGDSGWTRYPVENGAKGVRIEAGGDYYDIDCDGDLDILQGAQSMAGEIWWWENPCPDFQPDKPWQRHQVIAVGGTHHDQIFGDFDGDGKTELAFWYNGGKRLYLAEIPADPAKSWPCAEIARFDDDKPHPEGLSRIDVDLDGKLDIVGGGYWFKHIQGKTFRKNAVDTNYRFTRSAAGDLIKGGRPEIAIGSGDGVGPLNLYEWDGQKWVKHTLIDRVDHGHSLQVADINADGNLDIYTAEMYRPGAGKNCRQWVLYGDGTANFQMQLLSKGIGSHESKVGDLDGDGDLDILQKDFQQDRRVDVWLNTSRTPDKRVHLWNGRDFYGWKLFVAEKDVDVKDVWSVRDGVILCAGVPNGYMRTEKDCASYHLHVEWRWPGKPTNSGVLLHMTGPDQVWPRCIESQLMSGHAGDFWLLFGTGITVDGKVYSNTPENNYVNVKKKTSSSENPPGQWNTYDIFCIGDTIRNVVNGVEQNYGIDASVSSGKICVQSEGSPIEFRNVFIIPIR